MEKAKKCFAGLDVIIRRLYEDSVLGNFSMEWYQKMTSDYEEEQEWIRLEMESVEAWIDAQEADNNGLDAFVALTRKYVDVTEPDAYNHQRVYQEDRSVCTGQIQRQAKAEN